MIFSMLTSGLFVTILAIYLVGAVVYFFLGCLDPEGRSLGYKPLVWPYLFVKSLLGGE